MKQTTKELISTTLHRVNTYLRYTPAPAPALHSQQPSKKKKTNLYTAPQYKMYFNLLSLSTLLTIPAIAMDSPPLKAGIYDNNAIAALRGAPPKGGTQGPPPLYSCPLPKGADQYVTMGVCKPTKNCIPTEAAAEKACSARIKNPKAVTRRTCTVANGNKWCWACCRK